MGLEETKQAIEAASKAFKTWSKTSAKVRFLLRTTQGSRLGILASEVWSCYMLHYGNPMGEEACIVHEMRPVLAGAGLKLGRLDVL